jgi:hypothetical protein
MFRAVLASWNPNKYHKLQELTFTQVIKLLCATIVLSLVLFVLLLVPALLHAHDIVENARSQSMITLNGTFEQQGTLYIAKNPDIVIGQNVTKAFIGITPREFVIRKYLFFGEERYPWSQFQSLATAPVDSLFVWLFLFSIPSIIVWGAIALCLLVALATLLYSFIAYFYLHAQKYSIKYKSLLKVALYAMIPSVMLFGFTPLLRYGLPLLVLFSFMFVLWLVLAMLGTTLYAEKKTRNP